MKDPIGEKQIGRNKQMNRRATIRHEAQYSSYAQKLPRASKQRIKINAFGGKHWK